MNVIGDVGLVIAAFLILDRTGQLDYLGVFERADVGAVQPVHVGEPSIEDTITIASSAAPM